MDKPRKAKHPPINIFHLAKFAKDSEFDFYIFVGKLNDHYGYKFSNLQVRNQVKAFNKHLVAMGVAPITFNDSRKNKASYVKEAVLELVAKGVLEMAPKAGSQDSSPKKPTTTRTKKATDKPKAAY